MPLHVYIFRSNSRSLSPTPITAAMPQRPGTMKMLQALSQAEGGRAAARDLSRDDFGKIMVPRNDDLSLVDD